MSELNVTSKNFDEEVVKSDIPVLLDFWASWCGPCKMMSPVVDEIAEEYAGKIKVGKVNVDEEQELAAKFDIASIPTLLIFKGGEVAAKSVGFKPKEAITSLF